WGYAKVQDDFVVDGIPSGTPVSIAARLDFGALWSCGSVCGLSGVNANITQGAQSASWHTPSCNPTGPDCDHTLNSAVILPIQAIAGTSFRVTFEVWGSAGESMGKVEGTISFDNLPAHAVIHSCNGFVQGQVATHPVSWGRLKAAYR